MPTRAKEAKEHFKVKRYKVQQPIGAYIFPREARIRLVRFDHKYLHLDLTDGRRLSVPLKWIPTLFHAPAAERKKFELNRSRTMIIWDPEKCAINDEVRLADYLAANALGKPPPD